MSYPVDEVEVSHERNQINDGGIIEALGSKLVHIGPPKRLRVFREAPGKIEHNPHAIC